MPNDGMLTHGRQTTSAHHLLTWSVPTLSAIRIAPNTLPSHQFACLLAADTHDVPDDQILDLADHLLLRGMAYFCAWGAGCERVHDLVDHAVDLREMRDNQDYPVMTTWHANETLKEAAWFLLNVAHPEPTLASTCQVRLGIAVANVAWADQLQQLFNASAT
jgi:hypothetical protein